MKKLYNKNKIEIKAIIKHKLQLRNKKKKSCKIINKY